jgi:Protein of unknown function (DUF559)/Transcriptional regulator, AbiEi antitoxin
MQNSAIPPPDHRIAELATSQDGVVSRDQLAALGIRRGSIAARIRSGRLHRVHRGVYAVGRRGVHGKGLLWAAVLACGERAVVSHVSAADLWEIRRSASRVVHVAVARTGRVHRRGLVVHRTVCLPENEVTRCEGIPVTSVTRTLLDLAEVIPRRALERAMDEAERLRVFDERALREVLESHPGRRGSPLIAAVLEDHAVGSTLTRSELEERFLALCEDAGIEGPEVNAKVGRYEVDFLWPEKRLIVETDGEQSHRTRAAFERDRARDARLTAMGYRVMRFTHRQITREPRTVERLLRVTATGRMPS